MREHSRARTSAAARPSESHRRRRGRAGLSMSRAAVFAVVLLAAMALPVVHSQVAPAPSPTNLTAPAPTPIPSPSTTTTTTTTTIITTTRDPFAPTTTTTTTTTTIFYPCTCSVQCDQESQCGPGVNDKCYCDKNGACQTFNDCCDDFLDFCEVCSEDCPIGQYNQDCDGSIGYGFNCQPCTNAVAGQYYTSPGSANSPTSCSRANCDTACPIGEYRANCEFQNNPGSCEPCTTVPLGFFFTSNGGLVDNCLFEECTTPNPTHCIVGDGVCTCAECEAGFNLFDTQGDNLYELCTPTTGVCSTQDTEYALVEAFTGNPLNARPLGAGVDGDGNVIFCRSNGLLYRYDDTTETLSEFVTYDDGGDPVPDTDCTDLDVGPHFGDVYYVTNGGVLRVFGDTAQSTTTLLTTGLGDASGVAVDTHPLGEAKVFVSDASGDVVRQYDTATDELTTLAITGLSGPTGVAIDRPAGNALFICDTGNSVVKRYDLSDNSVTTLPFVLNAPTYVTIDMSSQELFISDTGDMAVYRFNQIDDDWTGTQISTLPSSFSGFNLNTPVGIAVTLKGTVLVADSLNKRILRLPCDLLVYKCSSFDDSFNTAQGGEYVGTFPVFGGDAISVNDVDTCTYGFAPNAISTWDCNASTGVASSVQPFCVMDGGNCIDMNTTLTALFTSGYEPYDIDIDSGGNLLFAGAHTNGSFLIHKYDAATQLTTTLYTLQTTTVGGLAIDNEGNLFVADPESGSIYTGDCRDFENGVCNAYTTTLDLWSSAFTTPVAIDLDPANNLYIADAGLQKLFKYNSRGSIVATLIGSGVLDTPVGVAVDDSTGDLYVSDKGTDAVYYVACDDLNNNCEIVEDCPFRSLCDATRDPAYICCPDGWAGDVTAEYCSLPDSVDIYNDYLGEDPPADTCIFYGGTVTADAASGLYKCTKSLVQPCDTYSAEVLELVTGLTPDTITVDRDGNLWYVNTDDLSVEKYVLATGATEVVIAAGLTAPHGVGLDVNGDLYITDADATSIFRASCLELKPTCSDSAQNGIEEGVDCGGDCEDRCQDIAAEPVWFVYRDHSITTSQTSSNDVIDHGVQTLEQCQGLCHAGVSPTADARECVGFTMKTDVLNWPLGATCYTYFTDFTSSVCTKRELTGAKAFLCYPAPPLFIQDWVVYDEDDVTAFLYKRGDPNLYSGIIWYALGEHQHIGDSTEDYVSLGALPLEDCMVYCLEYEGCLGITNDNAQFHEECILYLTDFSTAICRDYDQFTERCSDLYPYNNMNVVRSNAAYNAYTFEAINYNGYYLYRTHQNGYIDGTVDSSTTEASFITSIENCKLYCIKHDDCMGFRSDDSDCIVYSSYIVGSGPDATRTSVNVTSAGVEHWIKYQQWHNAKCDPALSTGGTDHGAVFKLSDCLGHCETTANCSAIEFAFTLSTCKTYTTCIGILQTPLHDVYGTVGFIEAASCVDETAWASASGDTCETSACTTNAMYQAWGEGSYWTGVSNDTIAPDCLDADCCKWRCFYHDDCVASTFRTYSDLFWNFDTQGYPCITIVNLTNPKVLVVGAVNDTDVEAHFVKLLDYNCDEAWAITLPTGALGWASGALDVLDCRDSCANNGTCWGFTWQHDSTLCRLYALEAGVVPAHNLTGDKSVLSCRYAFDTDGTSALDECCSCGGGIRQFPFGAQKCTNDGRAFPKETTPLCVEYNTTDPSGAVLTGTMVVREDSATDGALWTVVSANYPERTAWCDRNVLWDLDVRACSVAGNVTSCGDVLHTSPGTSADGTTITCSLTASGCPSSYPFGFELGAYCCDVTTDEVQQIDDPVPDDLSWVNFTVGTQVTVDDRTGSHIFVRRHGPDVSFSQCTSGNYIECPQAGTYQLGDNCRNHTGYWNVPAAGLWAATDQNGLSCNQTLDVTSNTTYDMGEPEAANNTWYIQVRTEVRYFFNGLRLKVGQNAPAVVDIQRSRYGVEWDSINQGNFTVTAGLDNDFMYEFQDFDTFSGEYWRVVITAMEDADVNPDLYWIQFYTPLEKPCLVPTVGNGSWNGDGCFEGQDQAQDLTCSFEANDGYYCTFRGEYYCDAGVWLFTAESEAADQDPYKDTDDPAGLGYGFYDGNLRNDRDGWDETVDFKLGSLPANVFCSECNPDNACPVGEYMVGCGGISAGSCGPCTNAAPGEYYTSNAKYTDTCATATCSTDCPAGEYNAGCEYTTSEGECTPCSGQVPGSYFSSDGDLADACAQTVCPAVTNCNMSRTDLVTCTTATDSHCPFCDTGYWLYEDTNGPDQCRACNTICAIGSYLRHCGNSHYPYYHRFAADSKCAPGLGATLLSYTLWTNATDCAASCKAQAGCTMFDNSDALNVDTGLEARFCHMYGVCGADTLRADSGTTVFEYVKEPDHDGYCEPCTAPPAGSYHNSSGAAGDSCTHAECPAIANCAAAVTCAANVSTAVPQPGDFDYDHFQVQPTDVRCPSCAAEMFADNYTCTAETWRDEPACSAVQDLCVACLPVANCASNVTCTSLATSQCTACDTTNRFYLDNSEASSRCLALPVTTYTEAEFNASFGTWAAQCDGGTLAFGTAGADQGHFANFTEVETADLVAGITSLFQNDPSDTTRWHADLTATEQCVVAEYFAQFATPSVSVLEGTTYSHYVFNIAGGDSGSGGGPGGGSGSVGGGGVDAAVSAQVLELVQDLQLTIAGDDDFADVFEYLQLTSLPANTAFVTVTLYSAESPEAVVDYAAMLDNHHSGISPSSYYTVATFEVFDSAGQYIASTSLDSTSSESPTGSSSVVQLTSCLADPLGAFMAFTLAPYVATFSVTHDVTQQVGSSHCYATSGAGTFVVLVNGCDGIAPTVARGTPVCDLATQVGDTCPVINDANYNCGGVTVTCSLRGEYEVTGSCSENQCVFAVDNDSEGYAVLDRECGFQSRTVAHCQSSKYVVCAAGYTGTVALSCGTDAGGFALSGCTENVCSGFPPSDGGAGPQLDSAFAVLDATCGGATRLTRTACESPAFVGCNPATHSGTVALTCHAPGLTFALSGCEANLCVLPPNTSSIGAAGYELLDTACSEPAGSGTAAGCGATVACAAGFDGTPVLTCRRTDTYFALSGCVEHTCAWPAVLPDGHEVLDETCGGRTLTTAACNHTGLFVRCAPGYEGAAHAECSPGSDTFALGGCVDIDECATGTHDCAAGATCANRAGWYVCVCPAGYVGDGFVCTDDDECALEAANDCAAHAACTNTNGGYTCACDAGFAGDGFTCVDDEPPVLALTVVAGSTLFFAFGERFRAGDLVLSCADSAGAATVSFHGDSVDTAQPGAYVVLVNCTDGAGLYVSASVTVLVGHNQAYAVFADVAADSVDSGDLDAALGTAGLTLTCATTLQLRTGWHPLLVLLDFTLCGHDAADFTAAVRDEFVTEVAGLGLEGVLAETVAVVSVVDSGVDEVVVTVSMQLAVELEAEEYVCTDVRCDRQNTCTPCEA